MLRITRLILISLATILLSSSLVIAQSTLGTVAVTILGNNEPLEGVNVYLDDGITKRYGQADENGYTEFFGIPEGTYTLVVDTKESFFCDLCSAHQKLTQDNVTISTLAQGYTAETDTQDLGTVNVPLASQIIEVTVTDQNNQPVVGLSVDIWHNTNLEFYGFAKTNSQGVALLSAIPGSISVSTFDEQQNYTSVNKEITVAEDAELTQVSLQANKTDAVLEISVHREGNLIPPLQQGEFIYVSCTDSNFETYFGADVPTGDNKAEVKVVGGIEYTCTSYGEAKGYSSSTVVAISGQTTQAVIVEFVPNHTIVLKFVDEDGNSITGLNLEVFASTDAEATIQYFASTQTANNDGHYELEVVKGGKYWISYHEPFSFSSKGVLSTLSTNYLIGNGYFEVDTTDAESPQESIKVLEVADATATVTVLDSSQIPLVNAWVDFFADAAGSPSAASEDSYIFAGGITDQNGVATISLKSGIEYTLSIWPSFEENVLPPAPQTVTPVPGTNTYTAQTQNPDITLAVALSFSASGLNAANTLDWGGCSAYNNSTSSFGNLESGSVSLQLVSRQDAYTIDCYGAVGNEYHFGSISYEGANPGSDSATVPMSVNGAFYERKVVSFDASKAQSYTLPDLCSILNIPAKAIADSGTITAEFGSREGGTGFTKSLRLQDLWDISFRKNGETIENFQKPLTIDLCISSDTAEKVGGIQNLTCASENDSGNGFSPVTCQTSEGVNSSALVASAYAGTASLSLSKAKDFGFNVAGASSGSVEPGPTSVKVKKAKSKKSKKRNKSKKVTADISWTEVENATSYTVYVQKDGEAFLEKEVTVQAAKKKKNNKNKNKGPSAKITLKQSGTYSFSVAALLAGELTQATEGNRSLKVKGKKKKKKKKKKSQSK